METQHHPSSPEAWGVLVGEYELITEQPEGCRGPPIRTALRLEARGDPPRLTGEEEYPNDRAGGMWREPVSLDGEELLIGNPAAEGGPSRYRITGISPEGLAGVWRTYQPAALRQRQPQTPEWAVGTFTARRRQMPR